MWPENCSCSINTHNTLPTPPDWTRCLSWYLHCYNVPKHTVIHQSIWCTAVQNGQWHKIVTAIHHCHIWKHRRHIHAHTHNAEFDTHWPVEQWVVVRHLPWSSPASWRLKWMRALAVYSQCQAMPSQWSTASSQTSHDGCPNQPTSVMLPTATSIYTTVKLRYNRLA